MKKSKFMETLIAFTFRRADEGAPITDVWRKAGISEATFYNWRNKQDGLLPSGMMRLRRLEEENGKLKKLLADLSLDHTHLMTAALREV